MESIKPLSEVTQPDDRQLNFVNFNRATGEITPRTLDDIYLGAAEISLSENVPESIRSHFSAAQNLLVYSWFHYPFNVTAQFMAFVTVELALKERLKPNPRTVFKDLISMAVARGLIKEEGFSHRRGPEKKVMLGVEFHIPEDSDYCQSLAEVMPYLRNELAHGSNMLHPNGLSGVRICAEFIEQLFKSS